MDLFKDTLDVERDSLLRYLATDGGSRQLAEHLAGGGTFLTFAERWVVDQRRETSRIVAEAVMSIFQSKGSWEPTDMAVYKRLEKANLLPLTSMVSVSQVLNELVEQGLLVRTGKIGPSNGN